MKNFIDAKQLLNNSNTIIIDVRRGTDNISGQALYQEAHVIGAYFLDLEDDLSGEVTKLSGAHPLPDCAVFQAKLRQMGANDDTSFIIYDDGDLFVAARAWFVLKYFGIESVRLVRGGFPAIKDADIPLTDEVTSPQSGMINLKIQNELVVDFDAVKDFSENGKDQTVLLDARSKERYLGETEPLYTKAGHIPRAQSYFYQDVLTDQFDLKPTNELIEYFKPVIEQEIMVACGSGVTAAMTMIALDELGKKAKLYPGSYSEWINRDPRIETRDETKK